MGIYNDRILPHLIQLGMKQEIPPQDAFAVTLHLAGVSHHELWVRGRPSSGG